jgi:hypothetical protein
MKEKGKRQKAKKKALPKRLRRTFAFCLFPFSFGL